MARLRPIEEDETAPAPRRERRPEADLAGTSACVKHAGACALKFVLSGDVEEARRAMAYLEEHRQEGDI